MGVHPTRPVIDNRSARNLFLARHALSEDRYARSRARAHHDLIEEGPLESVGDITKDKAIGISCRMFYKLKEDGSDDELVHRYARSRARAHRDLIADGPKESVIEITASKAIGISRPMFYRMPVQPR